MLIGFESPAIISSLALLRYGQMKQGLSILSGLFYLGLPNYFKPNNSKEAMLNYMFFLRSSLRTGAEDLCGSEAIFHTD